MHRQEYSGETRSIALYIERVHLPVPPLDRKTVENTRVLGFIYTIHYLKDPSAAIIEYTPKVMGRIEVYAL